jgi:hypothetical protein
MPVAVDVTEKLAHSTEGGVIVAFGFFTGGVLSYLESQQTKRDLVDKQRAHRANPPKPRSKPKITKAPARPRWWNHRKPNALTPKQVVE